jgi:hypothetical protein
MLQNVANPRSSKTPLRNNEGFEHFFVIFLNKKSFSIVIERARREIPSNSPNPDSPVMPCGKLSSACGKTPAYLWKLCGIRGENLGEK